LLAKFEVRSFECIGSGQRSSLTLQNRWTQVRGPEIDRRQSLFYDDDDDDVVVVVSGVDDTRNKKNSACRL